MAPTSIDGTEITGATIDGQDVSEITVDGETVFTAIPDSVEHRWSLSEGGGTTAADSVGSNDMSISGATWISGDYVDGYALDPDGSDDYGLVSTFYDSNNVVDHGLAFTIDGLTQDATNIMGTRSDGFVLLYDGANEPNAAPSLRFRDDTGTDVYFVQPAVDLNDGNKHRIIFNIPSADANDAEIYVDGSSVSVNVEFNGSYSGSVTLDSDTAFFARSTDGSIFNYIGTILDDIQFNTDQYSASEAQDDYDGQPWS